MTWKLAKRRSSRGGRVVWLSRLTAGSSPSPAGARAVKVMPTAGGEPRELLRLQDTELFAFWPLHPAGYAIASNTWTFGWLWFSVFISWSIKSILLRFGGIGLYRKAYPLFLGLILGEYLIGGGWVLIRLFFGVEAYSFYR